MCTGMQAHVSKNVARGLCSVLVCDEKTGKQILTLRLPTLILNHGW